VLAQWLVQEGEGGKERDIELVVAGNGPDERRVWGKLGFNLIDSFALYLRSCALHMCIFLTLTSKIKRNGHIETRPQVQAVN